MRPVGPPPRGLRLLARVLLPRRDREFIVGDLEEAFARRARRSGRPAASWRYAVDLLASAAARRLPFFRGARGARPPGPEGPVRPWTGLGADLLSAGRALRRDPSFTAVAVFTLSLGIGTTTAVFGMADRLLLRPHPGVHDDGRTAYLRFRPPDRPPEARQDNLSTPQVDALRERATLVEGVASYGFSAFDVRAGEAGRPALGEAVYGDFFGVLGVRPEAGRLLTAAETLSRDDVLKAVLSRPLARDLFGSPAGAVGRTVRVRDHALTVVGVAGDGFRGSQRGVVVDLWVPFGALAPLAGLPRERVWGNAGAPHGLFLVRPRAGADLEAVRAQLRAVARGLARRGASPEAEARLGGTEPHLTRGIGMPPDLRPGVVSSLRLVGAAVGLVLLIACANVANLFLFRNVARRGALTTRRALGASPGRIAREQLAHGLLLGLLGAAAGVGVGWILSLLLEGQALGGLPAGDPLRLDARVVLFAAGAAVVTALLFGALPAALAGRFDLAASLNGAAGGRHSGRRASLRAALASGQLALTLTLGVGALLLVRTVHRLSTTETGLDARGVVSTFQPHDAGLEPGARHGLAREVLGSVEALPEVERAALGPPDLEATWGTTVLPVGVAGSGEEDRVDARVVPVSPGWFTVFRVPAETGRLFRDDDWTVEGGSTVVLTASLARKLFGDGTAVGRTLAGLPGGGEAEVVGVVPDLSGSASPGRAEDVVFRPYDSPPAGALLPLVARVRGGGTAAPERIGRALAEVLPGQPVRDPRTVDRGRYHREQRDLRRLLGLLTVLAAALASVGLYGIVSFVVAGRRREFGIRAALGSRPAGILALVARYGGTILGVGTGLGLAGAYALSHLLRSRLYDVGTLDPPSYLGAAAFLALVAALACGLPAWRATRLDPATTLREE